MRETLKKILPTPIRRVAGEMFLATKLKMSKEENLVEIEGITARFKIHNRSDVYRLHDNFEGKYAKKIIESFKKLGTKGKIVNVGAAQGFYAVFSALAGNDVTAIEPDPENYAFLKKNALINNLKIKLHPIALSKNHGHSKFFVSSMKILSSINPIKGAREIDVLVSTLDRVLDGQQTGRTLIKIDVEGAELDVLKGAEETMKGEVSLIMEVHPQHVKLQDIETHLQNRGFSTNVRRGVKRSFPHILTAHKINPCQLPVPEGNIKN